jgi:hypothetical protein
LQRGYVRKTDAFTHRYRVVGIQIRVSKVFEQPVGVRLQVRPGGCRWVAPFDDAQTDVGCDAVQPAGQGRARLVAGQATPRSEHRLLKCVVGIMHRAEHPIAVDVERAPVWRSDFDERVLVPGLRGREQRPPTAIAV